MSDAPASTTAAPAPAPSTSREPAAVIDASLRWPVLTLFLGALAWLGLGTVFSVIGSIKLHAPGFLADSAWLTAGRVRPGAMNALFYGFASQAALGVLLWIMSRLGGARFQFAVPVVIAAKLWNLGVLVGVWGILVGGSTGFELLEMPRYASPILFAAYTVIGICAVMNHHGRRERTLYPSQWFLLAALFWFPWVYSAANLLLVFSPVRGTMQAVVSAWAAHLLPGLWLGAVALGAIYYFIPRLSGRPLYSAPLAAFGFWTWAVATAFGGLNVLTGGPVPRWLPALSTAATIVLLVPLLAAGINWYLTLAGRSRDANEHLLRFFLAAAVCYFVGGVVSFITAFPNIAALTNLTLLPVAMKYLLVLGFVGFALLGGIYYIVPQLLGAAWPRPQWVRAHYLCHLVGVGLIVGPLAFGGLIQGGKMANPDVAYAQLARSLTPWIGMSSLGLLWLLIGQALLAVNLVGLLRSWCRANCICCTDWLVDVKPAKAGGGA